jgi:biotin transport system substrate-specific component
VVLICPPAQAALVVGLYLVLGAAGAPVFSGARGGLAALVGPTGGYLVGFWLGAVAGSLVRVALPARRSLADTAALGIALVCVYLPGTAWLALSTGRTMAEAVIVGAAPFVVFDIAKGVGAASVVAALRRAGLVPAPSRSAGAEPSQAVC